MREPLTVAYYCTAHGLGHATRSIEICKHLVEAGHSVTVVTGAPRSVFLRELPPQGFTFRRATLDSGAQQVDAFSVDQRRLLEEYYKTAVQQRQAILESEVGWLSAIHADLVVSDIVPLAAAAAAAALLPCICVSNFSWDFIYSEYLTTVGSGEELRKVVWQVAEDYSRAQRLLRLPGYVPTPAFREVQDVPLVVRHARKSREQVRAELGLADGTLLAVFMYGGQLPGKWKLAESCLPPGWVCVVCSAGKPPGGPGSTLPPNFMLAAEDSYTPDLVAASDVVIGKIGYGSASECLAHGRPLVFTRRDYFNEEPFLRKLLEVHDAAVEMKRRDFLAGNWAPYLESALALRPSYPYPTNGAEVVAALLERAAYEWKDVAPAGASGRRSVSPVWEEGQASGSGSARLRDIVVCGYVMQRHASREQADIPEWMWDVEQWGHSGPAAPGVLGAAGASTPGAATAAAAAPPTVIAASAEGKAELTVEGFVVTQSNPDMQLESFPDTLHFLEALSHLDDPPPPEGLELPERKAARGLFRWEDEVVVARAPGRLDVMGGIADYSGSLVLQMPLAEACHVAVQRHPPHKQRLWRHMELRQSTLSTPSSSPAQSASDADSPSLSPHSGGGTPTTHFAAGATSSSSTTATSTSDGIGTGGSSRRRSAATLAARTSAAPTRPAVRVVSFHADVTNRGPAFDMDLSELLQPVGAAGAGAAGAGLAEAGAAAAANGAAAAADRAQRGEGQQGWQPVSYQQAREYFRRDVALSWAAYVVGALIVLMRECGLRIHDGLSILVSSDVPEGKGVSSSAAVEVATMSALAAAYGLELEGRQLALLCQKLENEVVGAPCGVMDQMASALGEEGRLLALRCQPAEVEGTVAMPGHLRFWGVDSGIRHSVGGSDYGAVRVGAFMGLRIASQLAHERQLQLFQRQQRSKGAGGGTPADAVATDPPALAPVGAGYLVNLPPSLFSSVYEPHLPATITGKAFLEAYGSHWDGATRVDPGTSYAVRIPAGHPVFEHFRVRSFRQGLSARPPAAVPPPPPPPPHASSNVGAGGGSTRLAGPVPANGDAGSSGSGGSGSGDGREEQLSVLGELMYQSHASYSACGLGSQGTDRIVALVREEQESALAAGEHPALFGAKITGGGCGGTVCVLGRADKRGEAALSRVVARYAEENRHAPKVFSGSSAGASAFGSLRLQRRGVQAAQ